jgi:hypothetical protein
MAHHAFALNVHIVVEHNMKGELTAWSAYTWPQSEPFRLHDVSKPVATGKIRMQANVVSVFFQKKGKEWKNTTTINHDTMYHDVLFVLQELFDMVPIGIIASGLSTTPMHVYAK